MNDNYSNSNNSNNDNSYTNAEWNRQNNEPIDQQVTNSHPNDYINQQSFHTNESNTTTMVSPKTTQVNPSEKKASSSKGALFLSSLIGGLTVAIIGFFLLSAGVIQIDQAADTQNGLTNSETTSVNAAETENESAEVIPTVAYEETNSLAGAIDKVSDAVVGVTNIQQAGLWTPTREAGTGSGVIYKKEDGKAYVVTNNHVVEGASEVEIVLSNGEHVKADVLGTDQLTDLAVLEMDGEKVTQIATLGSSDSLNVGDTAIAIGNPLGKEFAGTVTKGIISGLERSVEVDLNGDNRPDWTTEVIQTDAAINPGNSGGALINVNGEVIGINSMKIAQEAIEGIGFAIPIDQAKPIIEQLETDGNVSRPFVGISAVNLSTVPTMNKEQTLKLGENVTDGVVIAEVQNGSPADEAGLQRYDVITKMNDQEIKTMMEFKQYLYAETKIGEQVTVTYFREGQKHTTTLVLSEQNDQ